ncbi:hypothetical protein SDRG_12751 [Saprolegnia diclina VS20]|uniref:Uncharacterized protein n=1 Tax=Saprolegnia diclina (strain VS20) TaxID=1156394 RepID=T0RBG6_SAPDV|nr:hypothetical protein SDRG_12751 [Saprolegnia diclina VS20]EQC29503.1 hypothetical protein SDRG_12751 [Saprolegnia diclina VS20]|eukprot:XP_008617055.1 hypothetical protein SDRG_12751 [Saprolegnia diclina VS20]
MLRKTISVLLTAALAGAVEWNQSTGYQVAVDFKGWSNFSPLGGGCVTCPYTCVRPATGPDGLALNFTNATMVQNLPAIYSTPVSNGCCYASPSKSKVMPSCNAEANPAKTEDCGFLYGPTLKWSVTDTSNPPNTKKPLRALLMASTDCKNFWAVQQTYVKMEGIATSINITGSKQINGGCYGAQQGSAILLAGCLSTELTFDKSATYTWDKLATKCTGLSGQCTRTNALWGKNLKCCLGDGIDSAPWDTQWDFYHKKVSPGIELSGPAVTAIVFAGVALLMACVHFGSKVRNRAKQTALMREQEASEDYEEVMTPLTGDKRPATTNNRSMHQNPDLIEHSLHEGDQIYKKKEDEVLFEGDLY